MKNILKIALAQLNPIVGDVKGNIIKLVNIRDKLSDEIDIIVVPELYVTGYPIDDLVLRNDFLELVENEIISLAKLTNDGKAAIILGAPRKDNKSIKNSVFVLDKEKFYLIEINIIFRILVCLMNKEFFLLVLYLAQLKLEMY